MLTAVSALRSAFLPMLALTAGMLGMCAIWVTAAILSRSPLAWLAFLAAVDMVFLLRLSGVQPGTWRAIAAVIATALTCLASYWMIAATQFGALLGLSPMESARRMGPVLAQELSLAQAGPYDATLLALALLLAGVAAHGPRRR